LALISQAKGTGSDRLVSEGNWFRQISQAKELVLGTSLRKKQGTVRTSRELFWEKSRELFEQAGNCSGKKAGNCSGKKAQGLTILGETIVEIVAKPQS